MKIRCIAIDDEKPARIQIEEYIKKLSFLEFMGVFRGGLDALAFLKNNEVDLIFLDIQMDDLTGIDFLQALSKKPKIIFTTAYDSYALEAFELDVTDYLLKPIAFNRFVKAVEKVYDLMKPDAKPIVTPENLSVELKSCIFVKSEYKLKKILLSDILYIEGFKEYLRIYTTNGEKIYTLMTFKSMEGQLPENQFVRCHKSFIVAIDKINYIEKNRISIGDAFIPIGESYKESFYSILGKNY